MKTEDTPSIHQQIAPVSGNRTSTSEMGKTQPPHATLNAPQMQAAQLQTQPLLAALPASTHIAHPAQQPLHANSQPQIAPHQQTQVPQQQHQQHQHQQKYHKIQPAAIKPKPVPIAMLPKPIHKSYFDPTPNLKTSIHLLNVNTSKNWVLPPRPRPGRKPTAGHGDDLTTYLPVAQGAPQSQPQMPLPHANTASQPGGSYNSKLSPKKKCKVTLEDENLKIINQLHQQFPNINGNSVLVAVPVLTTGASTADRTGEPPVRVTHQAVPGSVAPPQMKTNAMKNLKIYYVSKIKEQELVKNYIEVINKQIKELKFVQNGVITFDALNNEESLPNQQSPSQQNNQTLQSPQNGTQSMLQAPSTQQQGQAQQQTPITQQLQQLQQQQQQVQQQRPFSSLTSGLGSLGHEQLERINNINDLNKFLGYLTKSSNIIHSVTKKYNISDENLDSQIKAHLDTKAKSKQEQKLQQQQQRAQQAQRNKVSSVGSIGLGGKGNESSPSSVLLKPTLEMNTPLKSIEEDFSDDGIDVLSILKDTPTIPSGFDMEDLFTINELDDYILIDKGLRRDEGLEPLQAQANISVQQRQPVKVEQVQGQLDKKSATLQQTKRSKKISSCGFCSNGTPCLCLDADLEIRLLQGNG